MEPQRPAALPRKCCSYGEESFHLHCVYRDEAIPHSNVGHGDTSCVWVVMTQQIRVLSINRSLNPTNKKMTIHHYGDLVKTP
jgi:hypothetical protein